MQPLPRYASRHRTTSPASACATAGSPPTTSRRYADLARHRNVIVKLGPFHVLGDQPPPFLDLLPLLRRVIGAFGPNRCMWETDVGGPVPMSHPEEVYTATVELVLDHADFLSDADREWICIGRRNGCCLEGEGRWNILR